MLSETKIISWLLEGDVAIRYQVYRDLLHTHRPDLQAKISTEGWGRTLLSCRLQTGHWGRAFYHPKWISSHYTLLDLQHLQLPPDHPTVRQTLRLVFDREKKTDGGLGCNPKDTKSDVCVNGMALSYAAYFQTPQTDLTSLVDFLLSRHMPDGGFNCRSGAVHSSRHTTLSVLEGIQEYHRNGYRYRLPDLMAAKKSAEDFILMHRFFKSDKTGHIIKSAFLNLCYPCRWYYDILKALDYAQAARLPFDERMTDALTVLAKKRKPNGLWTLASPHPGQTHLRMEKPGSPSKWNTLRALRVLAAYPVPTEPRPLT